MQTRFKILLSSLLIWGFVFIACTSAKRKMEAVRVLRVSYSSIQDMEVVISAGATLEQYSQRLTDALLKFKDSNCVQAAAGLSNSDQQALVTNACQHLTKAMAAYTQAKAFFGDTRKTDMDASENGNNYFLQQQYDDVHALFPSLAESPVVSDDPYNGKAYWKSDMLQALWKVAAQETQIAKSQIEQLERM
jgi:hypothetical protein